MKNALEISERTAKISQNREEFIDSDGTWRARLRKGPENLTEFDKNRFLEAYEKSANKEICAKMIGTTSKVIDKTFLIDREFAEACLLSELSYRDKLISHVQDLIFNGIERTSYDKEGNIKSIDKSYPIRLIELELKKHDSRYKEKQEMTVTQSGGVLLVPSEIKSVDEFHQKFMKMLEIQDAVVVENE